MRAHVVKRGAFYSELLILSSFALRCSDIENPLEVRLPKLGKPSRHWSERLHHRAHSERNQAQAAQSK